jgi:hypothetical protein
VRRPATVALLGLLATAAAAGERPDLGRLFTTAAEREAIGRDRRQPPPAEPPPPPQAAPDRVPPGPPSVTVNGVIHRGDGRRVVWVNGARVEAGGDTPGGIRVLLDRVTADSVPVVVPGRPRPMPLKPGQTYDAETGAIRDGTAR